MSSQGARARRAWMLCGRLAVVVLLSLASIAHATSYTYDANGRLVAVTDDSGESARYVYDVMGNLLRVERIAASELRIFALTPTHGTVDTLVSIRGQGFHSRPDDHVVTFNGIVATVKSATPSELRVVVPYAATTGPVTVAVGGRTVTSETPFTVDDTGLPPEVGTVTPDIVKAGDAIAVDGSHLYPIPDKTSLRLGGRSLTPDAQATNIRLSSKVTTSSTSGRIVVQTPYGISESVQSVVVVPPGVDPGKVASRGVATVDSGAAHVEIVNGNQYAAVLFDSRGGQWLSMQLSGWKGSSNNIAYSLYGPGNVLLWQGDVQSNNPSLHLPAIRADGTYLVLIRTADSGSISLDASVVSNPRLEETVTSLTTLAPSQSVRAIFKAGLNETLVLRIAGASTTPSNANVTYSIYNPNGAFYTSGVTASRGTLNLPNLPMAGDWQVVASPGVNVSGRMDMSLLRNTVGALVPGDAPVHFDAKSSGQNLYIDFHAKPFDDIELTLANVTLEGHDQPYFQFTIYDASGRQVDYRSCSTRDAGASCTTHLWYMPEGDYRAVVTPSSGAGMLHFDAILSRDLVTGPLERDTTFGVDLSAGQVQRFSIDAQAGDTLALAVAGIKTKPAGLRVRFLVYRPDTGFITSSTPAYTDLYTETSQARDLVALPVTGRYTVIVAPDYGLAASAQVSLITGAAATLKPGEPPVVLDTHASGQSMFIDFEASDRANLELALFDTKMVGASYPAYDIDIKDSSGRFITTRRCNPNDGGCQLHLWYLEKGRYRATVSMGWGGTMQARAVLRDLRKGRILALDTNTDVVFDHGDAEHLTFHAEAGQTMALAVNSLSTNPEGRKARYIVYRPDVGAISEGTPRYTEFETTGPFVRDLPSLPVTGDYTVAVVSDVGAASKSTIQLLRGENESLPSDGTSHRFQTRVMNQSVYVDFFAHNDQILELTFSKVVQSGAQYPAYSVEIRDATGRYIDGRNCGGSDPGCQFHLWGLSAGSYRATVTMSWGGTIGFDAAVREHKMLPALHGSESQQVSLETGQAARTTFHAEAGDTLAISFSDVSVTPAGKNIRYLVYRPDGGRLVAQRASYLDVSSAGNRLIDLPRLPVSGDYTLMIIPDYGIPASFNVTLLDGLTGNLSDGSPRTFQTKASSQSTFMEFDADKGAYLELVVFNPTLTGAQFPAYLVEITDPAGRSMTTRSCNAGDPGCDVRLWNLAQGRYRATVTLPYGGQMKFDAVLRPHRLPAALDFGSRTSVDMDHGDVQRFTFQAAAGDTISLRTTALKIARNGVRLLLYRPDGGAIGNNGSLHMDVTVNGDTTLNVPVLPADGVYTLLLLPDYDQAAHIDLELMHGITGKLVTDDLPRPFQIAADRQEAYLTYHANADEDLQVSLLNPENTLPGNGNGFYVYIYDATSNIIASNYCSYGPPGCIFSHWRAKEGDYRIVVSPSSGGAPKFGAVVRRHRIAGKLEDGKKSSLVLGQGEAVRLTFDASLGDTRTLTLEGIRTTDGNQPLRVLVYPPNKGPVLVNSATLSDTQVTSTQVVTLENLRATGTYTAILIPGSGVAASVDVTERFQGHSEAPPPPPVTLELDTAPRHFASANPGEGVSFVLKTSPESNLGIGFSNATMDNGQTYYSVSISTASGRGVDNFNCWTSDPACGREMWDTAEGTYIVRVNPGSGGRISFDAVVHHYADGGALDRGVPRTMDLAVGDVARYTFTAQRGDTVGLFLDGIKTAPQNTQASIRVYQPDTGLIDPGRPFSSGSGSDRVTTTLTDLPVSGTYTVLVNAYYLAALKGSLTIVDGVKGDLVAGVPSHRQAGVPGEVVWLDLQATTRGNYDLQLYNVSTGDQSTYYQISIYDERGGTLDTYNCWSSDPGCPRDMWNLAPGRYRVAVRPQSNSAKFSFDAVFMPNRDDGPLLPGVVHDLSHSAGEIIRYTFEGKEGETLGIHLDGMLTDPRGYSYNVRVYRPDGGRILGDKAYTSFRSNENAGTLNLQSLPVTGTYTVVVHTDYLVPGSGKLSLVNGASDYLLTGGVMLHPQANASAQDVYLALDVAEAGDYQIALGNVSSNDGRDGYYQVSIFDQNGVNLDNFNCWTSDPGCGRDLWNRPKGRYVAVVHPTLSTSRLTFDAVLRKHTAKGELNRGTAVDITHGLGDMYRYTFHATAGETVALNLAGISTTPGGRNTVIRVYTPDVQYIQPGNAYATTSTSSVQTLNLSRLPLTGTYTVVLHTDNLLPGKGTLTLLDGVAGRLLHDKEVTHFDAAAPSQDIYFDLDMETGGHFDLALSNVSSNDERDGYYRVSIYDAKGINIDNLDCWTSSPVCPRDIWNAGAGIYHVVVHPNFETSRLTMNAVLRRNPYRGVLEPGVPADIRHEIGDILRYTFDAKRGDVVGLRLSGITTTPGGMNTTIRVYRPDGDRILPNNQYAIMSSRDQGTLNLGDMPATGTYTVVLHTEYLAAGQGALTLLPGANGIDLSNGTAAVAHANAPGQAIYMTATVGALRNFEFSVDSSNQPGPDTWVHVEAYNPDGIKYWDYNCYVSSGCTRSFWDLTAGTYRIVVTPTRGEDQPTFVARLQPNVVKGKLNPGEAVDIARASGELMRFTFEGKRKASASLKFVGLWSSPAGRHTDVRIYRPDGGRMNPDAPYTRKISSSDMTFDIQDLPIDGTYQVLIHADGLVPSGGTMTLLPAGAP